MSRTILAASLIYAFSGLIPWRMHMIDALDSVKSDVVAMLLWTWAITAPLAPILAALLLPL